MDVGALIRQDLDLSGLVPDDMMVRPIGNAERAAIQVPSLIEGFVIPYFDIYGRPEAFYRCRLFEFDPKYKQPKNSPNHIYYPAGFQAAQKNKKYVVITEGEKKAAAAVKAGIPCCALGGVDSWRNRILTVPGESALTTVRGDVHIKVPAGEESAEEIGAPLAIGFEALINHVIQNSLCVIICFDSDQISGPKYEVQRAAAALGFEFRFRGITFGKIKQLILPRINEADYKSQKVGLDDALQHFDPESVRELFDSLSTSKGGFPNHPNIRDFVNKRLSQSKLSRKDTQNVGLSILSDLDTHGLRLRSPTDTTYYFDRTNRKLLKATFAMNGRDDTFDAPFTQFLYQRYGLSAADNRLLIWLGTQFTSEEPIERVSPFRVFARPDIGQDNVNYQISDSQYIRVSADGIALFSNGSNNILFESDQVEPVDGEALLAEIKKQEQESHRLTNWWSETLSEVRLRDKDRPRVATSLLYYLSPFLHRWRGMQLPVELILGESGSGKSTLCALRLSILTGRASLRNAPQDLKDWHASVTSTGGLHVTDNVQLTDKNLRNRLSDEIAQPLDALILTTEGYRPMGSVIVGDTIIDPFGRRVKVTKEHPHGQKLVYRIVMSDGSYTESVGDHLWFVQNRDHFPYGHFQRGKVLSLSQIIDGGLTYKGKVQRSKWWIPNIKTGIDMTCDNLDYSNSYRLTPYILGVLLGDGNLSSKQISFFSNDNDIVQRVQNELPENTTLGSAQPGNYYFRQAQKLWEDIDLLDLKGRLAGNKFVPHQYLYTTADRRLQILQGLMDTDGTIHQSGTAIFSTTSRQLAADVKMLAESLGGRGKINQRLDKAFQVTVNLPNNICPFFCVRKSTKFKGYRHGLNNNARAIVLIEPVGYKEVKCITVDSVEGLYVTDNFITTHNCRIVTEPDPFIEQRRYYTNADLIRIPVRAVFAITAIQQPFLNADLLQRAMILEFDKPTDKAATYDSDWQNQQLQRQGGRIAWMAHHILVLQRFFQLVEKFWTMRYEAKYRLIHLEQAMLLMGKVFETDVSWIPNYLAQTTERVIAENDWVLEGIIQYCKQPITSLPERITAAEISAWAQGEEEYVTCEMLINARRLGRYLHAHKSLVATAAGLHERGNWQNRMSYSLKGQTRK